MSNTSTELTELIEAIMAQRGIPTEDDEAFSDIQDEIMAGTTKELLAIIEIWVEDQLTRRSVKLTPVGFDPVAEAEKWITKHNARAYRNGWENILGARASMRVSFEWCHVDDIDSTIEEVTL